MPTRTGVVTASSLNVRSAPSAESKPPIGSLPRGTSVEVLERRDGWYRVRLGSLEGFVSGDFLRVKAPPEAAGFLVDRPELRAAPLTPPESDRIQLLPTHGPTQRAVATTWNQFGGLLRALSEAIGIPTAASVAVLCVESSGKGFIDGRMVIRFENHVFFDQWGKKNPNDFKTCFSYDSSKRWLGHRFRPDPAAPFAPCHTDQNAEWKVFDFARVRNEAAAMRSISMGAPQIMGFNHALIGYDSVGEMFEAFQGDIRFQIIGMFDFIRGSGSSSRMVQALEHENFEQFASLYNGPGQASAYGGKIRKHFDVLRSLKPGLT